MSHTQVLKKNSETEYLFDGRAISKSAFLAGMRQCCYDIAMTELTLSRLSIGGKWVLFLPDFHRKKILKKCSPSSPLGFR